MEDAVWRPGCEHDVCVCVCVFVCVCVCVCACVCMQVLSTHLLPRLLSTSISHNPCSLSPPHPPHPLQVECAVHTGYNTVWVASGTPKTSEIAIIECRTTKPCITECFQVPDCRILSMVFVPVQQKEGDMLATEDVEGSQRAKEAPTVWVGCQDGK